MPKRRSGPAAQAYKHARAAGKSPGRAFEFATGRRATSLFSKRDKGRTSVYKRTRGPV